MLDETMDSSFLHTRTATDETAGITIDDQDRARALRQRLVAAPSAHAVICPHRGLRGQREQYRAVIRVLILDVHEIDQ
jgi:hypothetical protein